MSTFVIQQGLLGFVRLLATAAVAGWISSPMSWSPDAQWLSYTVAPGSEHDGRAPGWLFDASSQTVRPGGRCQESGRKAQESIQLDGLSDLGNPAGCLSGRS